MSQPWTNHINNAYFQYPGISSRAPNLGSHQTVSTVNNIGDVKTRAYVNPSFVKLPYPLPNPNNFTGSKKIHINPNFKRTNLNFFQSTNNAAQLRKESNYIHVNPNFNKFKICDTSNITSQYDHAPPSQKIGINPTQTNSQKGSADLSTNTNQCPPSSKPYPSNHNSTYFWSKYNTKSPQTTEQYESQQEILDNQKNIQIANNLAKLPKIKTRHKIVRTHSSSPISKEMNSKFKVKNKYKVVNIEKRIGNSSKTIKKINLTDLSKTNILSISRRENVKHGVQFIKLKTPSYKSNSIHRLTNLIKTKYKINRLTQRKKDMKLVSDGSTYRKKKFAQITDCYGKGYENRKLITKSVPAVKVCRVWKLGSSKNLFRVNRNSSWKNNVSIKDVKRKGKSYPNRALVNIGGIMYKSTVNKLTLASDKKQTSQTLKQVKPKVNSTVGKIGQVVYVRGEKFLLGDGGKTLIRQTNARSLVHYAKQRSIAVLKNLQKEKQHAMHDLS
ncbi:UNVERIFIED_CONTAM: hypothetical protein PYX00_001325 [Menopon gallinae]|uniref:Uncharacterized protein n=1 Tax=Menopon gallinae TaxID=328185 RepID=A0AAW2IDF9_9NEOP